MPVRSDAIAVDYSALTAVRSTSYVVIDGLGVRELLSPLAYVLWIFLIDGLGNVILVFIGARRDSALLLFRDWKNGCIACVLQSFSWGFVVIAMNSVPMFLVAATTEASLIFGFTITTVFLGERYTHWRAVSCIMIGSTLIFSQLEKITIDRLQNLNYFQS